MTRGNLARFGWAMLVSRGRDVDFRRRIGALALKAEQAGLTPTEEERLEIIGSRLLSTDWPQRPLVVTAVDAVTGEFRTFDREAGVPLVPAVAARCAGAGGFPPGTLHRRPDIDGGQRAAADARPPPRPARGA